MTSRTVLSIDPGRDKCGIALVSDRGVLLREIVSIERTVTRIAELVAEHPVEMILIGNGTGSDSLAAGVKGCTDISIEMVNEAYSSERARKRFFQENPPRGLRRFTPRGLLFPDSPYDDLVAVILAEEYLKRKTTS